MLSYQFLNGPRSERGPSVGPVGIAGADVDDAGPKRLADQTNHLVFNGVSVPRGNGQKCAVMGVSCIVLTFSQTQSLSP